MIGAVFHAHAAAWSEEEPRAATFC